METKDQIYYTGVTGGLANNASDVGIIRDLRRKMNKLPFYSFLRVQYRAFDPNNNFKTVNSSNPLGTYSYINSTWNDLPGGQIKGSSQNPTVSSNVVYTRIIVIKYYILFFKDTEGIVLCNNGQFVNQENTETVGISFSQDIIKMLLHQQMIILM